MERQPRSSRAATRARFLDRVGRRLIAVGGIGIIAAVLGIFLFILREAYPLFGAPSVQERGRQRPAATGFAVQLDPYGRFACVVDAGGPAWVRLDREEVVRPASWTGTSGGTVSDAALSTRNGLLAIATVDGRVILGQVAFPPGGRSPDAVTELVLLDTLSLDAAGGPLTRLAVSGEAEGRVVVVGLTDSGRVVALLREQQPGLLGPGPVEQQVFELTGDPGGHPTAVAIDAAGRRVMTGDTQGQVIEWRLPGNGRPATRYDSFSAAPEGIAITALSFLLGDVTVAVGDAQGRISAWFRAGDGQARPWVQGHVLQSHGGAIVRIAPSPRDRQFLTADVRGNVALHQFTSEQTFYEVATGLTGVADLVLAPKVDGFAVLGTGGELLVYRLENPHPEVSTAVLFGPVWYEGYPGRSFAWQSTGGSDDFEPKLSLVPLLFGTAKGTLYALLFSLPVAVLAALYTAEFAGPRVRGLVKPTVEIMASLPSVILGFLAGLWLAPLLDRELVGVLLTLPLVPIAVILAAWAWHRLPERLLRRIPRQFELLLLMAVILAAAWLSLRLGPVLELLAFPKGFPAWLHDIGGLGYDQRNCLVVGFAMGFAVIPLIFTICEDALSAVPRQLRAGSLALGATRWQTAVRVVLPMALPGIFSAAMIGFGRAIGETMIVLMATGNTPIMDWSLFDGMRTISANIAVELPEAPYHGTLYRVLFLSGLLLFAATFCINTLAELVRQRLRDRYNRL